MDAKELVRTLASCAGLVVAQVVCLILGAGFPMVAHHSVPIWLASSAALGWLMNSPRRRLWPLVGASVVGSVLAGILFEQGHMTGWLLAAAVHSVGLVGFYFTLRRLLPGGFDVTEPRHLIIFAGVAVVGSAVSAACTAQILGLIGPSTPGLNLGHQIMANVLGLVVLLPGWQVLMRGREFLRARPISRVGVASLFGSLLVSVAVFSQEAYPLLFLAPTVLLSSCMELELVGAAIGSLAIAVISTVANLTGHGPTMMMGGSEIERTLVLQGFVLVVTVASYGAAATAAQKRRISESLAASREQIRADGQRAMMAEAVAGVAYWRVDARTQELTWSDGMFKIFGVDPAHPPRHLADTREMIHPEEREAFDAFIPMALAGGLPAVPEARPPARIVRPDGEVRYLHGRTINERAPDGSVVAVFGTLVDVTDQQLAGIATVESEQRFRILAEHSADAIVRVNPEGRLIYASPALERILGVPVEIASHAERRDNIHPDDAVAFRETLVKVIAKKLPPGTRVRHRRQHADGRWLWLEAAPTPIYGSDGKVVEVVDVMRDITAQKAMETELETARKAAEAAAEIKSQFLANMSHELRTPLTAVLGFSSLLARQPELSEVAHNYVARLNSAGRALLSIINDVLDFSKLEAGGLELSPRPTSPAEVLRDAVDLFGLEAEAKGVTLVGEGFDALPAQVVVDPERLRQVLLNLIGNAVKFTDAGHVRVEARYRKGERLEVTVTDTGPGISTSQRGRLFQRFSQVDGTSTRRHGGSGLGLAICKGLVEAMGGEIGLKSRVGVGSTFWFAVPAAAADGLELEAAPATEAPRSGLRVLVVDDHPVNRQLARAVLEPFEIEVAEAGGGLEGVAAAQERPFDLILMDARMPDFDGISAMRAIREGQGPNREAVILAFSAEGGDDIAKRLAAGFDGHVAKPLTAADLLSAVARFTREDEAVSKAQSVA